MAYKKGECGNPAGRPKGATNIFSKTAKECFESLNFNPIAEMIDLAKNTTDENIRFGCYKELAQYYTPKLRSVEIKGDTSAPFKFEVNIGKKND